MNTQMVEARQMKRTKNNINMHWEFALSDHKPTHEKFWQHVDLPHTWNTEDIPAGGNNYRRGTGWYRKQFDLAPYQSDRRYFLYFEAASIVAEVMVNGVTLGEHRGAFAAFSYEVTNVLQTGTNEILVRVNNEHHEDVPPLQGDFSMYGGLYRSVHLITTSKTCVSCLDYASRGVQIKTKSLNDLRAEIEVAAKIDTCDSKQSCILRHQVYEADGYTLVSEVSSRVEVKANTVMTEVLPMIIDHPHRWHGKKDPYCYIVITQLVDPADDSVLDEVTQKLGLRTCELDPNEGFKLNGEHYALQGVCRHQDSLYRGWAITPEHEDVDMKYIIDVGATAVRLAHYPHSQRFYELCDEAGLVVWAELPIVDFVNPTKAFVDVVNKMTIEFARQTQHHPSICFDGIFNEMKLKEGEPELPILRTVNDLMKQESWGRVTVSATDVDHDELMNITDGIGLNYYSGWYVHQDDPEYVGEYVDEWHAKYPDKPIAISEYGAGASVQHHQMDFSESKPVHDAVFHPEEYQSRVHEIVYEELCKRDYLWGTFIWNLFDFAACQRSEGDHPGRNDKGIITFDRCTPKDTYYFYKANWSDRPVLYITSRRFVERSVGAYPVKVYTNLGAVKLYLDDQLVSEMKPNEMNVCVWDRIAFKPGTTQIKITADGYEDQCVVECR
ncbi:glycoside hydrolase family 2 protein [Poriferisphaera sp. WC338]|uniref:glycoside hydrolase family 2 protein n=1 Tax=Poriferisphaera sp. WC338 TaxID=3425129 RepID=UPI003D818C41